MINYIASKIEHFPTIPFKVAFEFLVVQLSNHVHLLCVWPAFVFNLGLDN
jgi:hypothetical protein